MFYLDTYNRTKIRVKYIHYILMHILSGLIFFVGIIYPWICLKVYEISQIGFNEESIGYRYFHTLRIVYGDQDFPWLPQGQLPGLFHMLIQIFITGLGYSINDQSSRIELFVDMAVLIQSVLIATAFVFSFSIIKSFTVRTSAAALFLIASYARSSFNWGMHMMTPDYFAWFLIPACIFVYAFTKLNLSRKEITLRYFVLLGLYAGLCASIKVTYLNLPFIIWLLMIATKPKFKICFIGTLISALVSSVFFILVLSLYYKFHFPVIFTHIQRLIYFISSAGDTYLAWQWLHSIVSWPIQFITFSMLLPSLFLTAIFFSKNSKICSILFVGTLIEAIMCWTRFNGDTSIETNAFAAATIIVFFILVIQPWLNIKIKHLIKSNLVSMLTRVGLALGGLWCLVFIAYSEINILILNVFGATSMTAESGKKLQKFLKLHGGRTLFLIPNNSLRPLTIDSAIYKGATDATNQHWGHSALMNRLFFDRWYIFGSDNPDVDNIPDINQFKTMVYSYFPLAGDPTFEKFTDTYGINPLAGDSTFKKFIDTYGINLNLFSCPFRATTGNGAILAGCVRKI